MLTNPVLDPVGKIPEFKYCAVKVSRGGEVQDRLSFGGGVLLPNQQPVQITTVTREAEPEPVEVG
jgi:formate dehydrogenase major subunit